MDGNSPRKKNKLPNTPPPITRRSSQAALIQPTDRKTRRSTESKDDNINPDPIEASEVKQEQEPASVEVNKNQETKTVEILTAFDTPEIKCEDEVSLYGFPSEFLKKDNGDWENGPKFLGYNEGVEEKAVLDKIERKSALLFEYITELKKMKHVRSVAIITACNKGGMIQFPESALETVATEAINIKIIRGPSQMGSLKQMLDWLEKPFEAGWKRELLYKSFVDARADIVQYISPDGTIVKNMEELMDYLENIYGLSESDGGLSKKNFSFYKSPLAKLGENVGELLYVVDRKGGKTLINPRKRSASSESDYAQRGTTLVPSKKQKFQMPYQMKDIRRSEQRTTVVFPPKVANSGERRSLQRTEFQDRRLMGQRVAPKNDTMKRESMTNRVSISRMVGQQDRRLRYDSQMPGPSSQKGDGEILPCSIRCPGMTGEVPNLQCKRCLCLYHAECLGLSNTNFVNFICANCVSKSSTIEYDHRVPKAGVQRPAVRNQNIKTQQMPRSIENIPFRQRIGQTVIIPEFQPVGKGNMSVRRMDSPTSSSQAASHFTRSRGGTVPRGMGRNVGQLRYPAIPQLTSTSTFSITPVNKVSRAGFGVPNLRPMLPNTNMNSRSGIQPFIRPGPSRLGVGVPRRQFPITNRSPMKMALKPGMKSSTGVGDINVQQRNVLELSSDNRNGVRVSHYRRWPQSVVAIGDRKYIAIPQGFSGGRSPIRNGGSELTPYDAEEDVDTSVNEGCEEASKNGFQYEKDVLKKVFPYLSVRDLLSARCVSKTWNEVACQKDFWRVVRMKNTSVFDTDGFVDFINKRESVIIDLRKMMGNYNWELLVGKLGRKVMSLKRVILGSRDSSPRQLEELNANCPDVR